MYTWDSLRHPEKYIPVGLFCRWSYSGWQHFLWLWWHMMCKLSVFCLGCILQQLIVHRSFPSQEMLSSEQAFQYSLGLCAGSQKWVGTKLQMNVWLLKGSAIYIASQDLVVLHLRPWHIGTLAAVFTVLMCWLMKLKWLSTWQFGMLLRFDLMCTIHQTMTIDKEWGDFNYSRRNKFSCFREPILGNVSVVLVREIDLIFC